jgi:hypothetical protein
MPQSPAAQARRQFLAFYALACLIVLGVMLGFFFLVSRDPAVGGLMGDLYKHIVAGGGYSGVAPIARFAANHPAAWLVLLFAAAPSIAAVCVAAASRGGALRRLLARLRPWQDVDAAQGQRVYAWLFGLHLLVIAASVVLVQTLVGGEALSGVVQALGGSAFFIALVVLLGAFGDEGGLLEELGWRGYALPLLQQGLASPLVAAVVLGFAWWAWHLPRELPTLLGGGASGTWVFNQTVFLLLCVALSIVIAWAVNLTGGSVLPAILIHGGTNVWSKMVQGPLYNVLGFSLRDVLMVLAAVVVLWIAGPRLGKTARD